MGAIWKDLTGNGPKPPPATDPLAQNARSQQGVQTNIGEQQTANRVNQTDAAGNQTTWHQTGVDANGQPIWAQSTTLGDLGQGFQQGFAGLGNQYFQQASALAGQGPASSTDALNAAYTAATAMSAPQQQRQTDQLDNQLRNQGLVPGMPGYDNAMLDLRNSFSQSNNTLQAQLQNQLWNQGAQGLAQRQQSLGLLAPGVSYGAGTTQGNFANVPGIGVQFIDPAAAYNNTFNQQYQNYKTQADELAGEWGAIGQLGGAAAKIYTASDERVKEDIKKVGKLDSGLPVYSYRYVGEPKTQIGVMAQEAEKVAPESVAEFGGVKHVDYKKLVDALT